MKEISLSELAQHNKEGDAWVAIDGLVYNISSFAAFHPGGKRIILQYAGQDASKEFDLFHGDTVMRKYKEKLLIGKLADFQERVAFTPPGAYGDMIPYGDPAWYQRFNSPYYRDSHRSWREYVRNFVEREIVPTIDSWCNASVPPADLYRKMGDAGLLGAMVGAPYPREFVTAEALANIPQDFDYFHELIVFDEISRIGLSSAIAAITNGPAIALSGLLKFGSEELKRRVAPDCLMGRKFIALAISEHNAGSDVAGMTTRAVNNGDHYLVTGNKKWITNGTYADFFVTAVVTGPPGHHGLSFLLIERDTPNFSVRKINVRSSDVSGTAYLDFNECKVPAANLIGKENQGFKLIMYNFNHERMYITCVVARLSRICLEESIRYALKRKTFGKTLSEHQVIRMKVAAMARAVEQLQVWLEFVVYQMTTMTHSEANLKIGDVMCLLKSQASRVYEFCARETTNIFGGNALHVDGPGGKIEPAVGQVKGYQIPAGAEDVMDDFAARTIFKMAKKMAKL